MNLKKIRSIKKNYAKTTSCDLSECCQNRIPFLIGAPYNIKNLSLEPNVFVGDKPIERV
jgi:hypothetical protein